MILSDILYKVSLLAVSGKTDIEIKNIVFDSRQVQSGSLFVAIGGTQVDGHNFIQKAIELGASAIICERLPEVLNEEICYLQVENSARTMGLVAANFYGNPSKKLKLVGVTGTNGKTSTVTLLFRLFRKLGYRCGLLSTVQNQIDDDIIPSTHTTPDSVKINELLLEMVQKGVRYCFMEVSSHSVVQERIAGLHFAGGIFTNITHDHLDFHETFDNYIKAKKGFFDQLPASAFALVNTDDKNGKIMIQNTAARKETYSLKNIGSFKGKILACGLFGLQMDIDGREVWFKLIGAFNAYNLLGVFGAAVLLGENPDEVLMQLSDIKPPSGRFEQVVSQNHIVGIVDYAHTPDALKNVLETIVDLQEGNQQIITVVGCGGNRDATKRPIMAEIASRLSNRVILTSDNPRNEDPFAILGQMEGGVPVIYVNKVQTIEDRREAIFEAVRIARPQDIILVAGKGHETYQDIKGVKHHFDDKEVLQEAFKEIWEKQ
ncbi:UDP-N-acetylmuramoyl-L-alanyl-D-glutamate--2,6-diaminopimelate ligase [Emticicia sp. 21SJ11W-3]|uniref:UDP-N-acetylmuramoyl-L-alanyl-D-glutamate--2, 6-diaminopimelate ligase n=1 Tax=Emticicia sp. 21SJ11W-3 TaxID=2916755 RepID=UPI00209ECA51|nr:UDP-N-acetylmuramoyl-L-alanyl-D-glutamate--2,6-diaminopimelate ligase [Emticicia sp. 21SJ11W-3]UTA68247.1 UDP-N-acetylmuramoyl-L-alanyl-D-glutamate--2,6-diaminopimelate ligase [Emticicia sp. 21SJ11W-3]